MSAPLAAVVPRLPASCRCIPSIIITPAVVTAVSTIDIAAASGQFRDLLSWSAITFPSIYESLPPTKSGTAYAPNIGMNVKSTAV